MTFFFRIFGDSWNRAYARLREPKTSEDLSLDEPAIERALAASPLPTADITIDPDEARDWIRLANYEGDFPDYYRENFHEKALEHFFAAKLLALKPGAVFIDVASQNGVAAQIYKKLYGATTFAQDLNFERGIHGNRIGGNAGGMPLPGNFADAMALHCSFEHFEGGSDMAFIREAGRVLKPGGRCVIAPLYIANQYCCLTDPALSSPNRVAFEDDMLLVALRTFKNRHGRFYDVPHLVQRIWNQRGPLDMTVCVIRNFRAVDPSCYLRYALSLHKPVR